MSPVGKWLLEHCDHNLRIDLSDFGNTFRLRGWRHQFVRWVAILLGITLEGGS